MNTLEVWLDPRSSSTGLEVIGVTEECETMECVTRRERMIGRWEGKESKVVIPLETGYGGMTSVRVYVTGREGIWLQGMRLLTVMHPVCEDGDEVYWKDESKEWNCPNGRPGVIEKKCLTENGTAIWSDPIDYCRRNRNDF